MDTADIRAFLLYLLNEKKVSTGFVNRCNSSLRFVFGEALQKTLNYQMIPRCRAHRDLPDILSKTELTKLFASIDNLRDKAILMTIYGAGLRISEVTHLRVQDIDSENMRLFVHHDKGQKDRRTLLSQANLELLREYWKQYRPKNPDGYLFYSRVGHYKQLTLRAVQNIMKKYLYLAGLPDHYTVHTLRHCFATHLLEDGVDVCRIKNLMGHAAQNNRSCAMVRFASPDSTVAHIYIAGKYTTDDVFSFAESFLNGGTDFETPLTRAVTLIEDEDFENADIMFITDGECSISDEFACEFRNKSKQLKFNVTGIIIGADEEGTGFSLTPLCEKVYRLSEMVGDKIASGIITSFVQ